MRFGFGLVIDRVEARHVLEELGQLGMLLWVDRRFQNRRKNVVQILAEVSDLPGFGNDVVDSRDLNQPTHVRRVHLFIDTKS